MANLSGLQKRGINQGLDDISAAYSKINQLMYSCKGIDEMVRKIRCLDLSECPEHIQEALKTQLLELHQKTNVSDDSILRLITSGTSWIKDATADQ